jgi:hypothetical protein
MAHIEKKADAVGPRTQVRLDATGKPDVYVDLLCPWCSVATETIAKAHTYDRMHAYLLVQCAQRGSCGRSCLVMVRHSGSVAPGQSVVSPVPVAGTTYPSRQVMYAPEGVDPSIAADFTEALRCREQGFLFASALVARRVLQTTARSIVGKMKDLYTEIEAIPLDRISKALRDAAHEVRFLGNAAAHAGTVTEADVDELLAFTDAYLDHLFVLPAKVARVKAARTAPPPGGGG